MSHTSIEQLMIDAERHGEPATTTLCRQAVAGDASAIRRCHAILASSLARAAHGAAGHAIEVDDLRNDLRDQAAP